MKKLFMFSVMFLLGVACATPSFAAMSDDEFFTLCRTGTPQQVQAAIKAGAKVNAKTEKGTTPLMFAAENNTNPEVITALAKAGADVNARNKDGTTPLMFAAERNSNPEVIAALIKTGANVRDGNGTTALRAAALNKTAAKDKIIAILEGHTQQQPKAGQGKTKPTDEEFMKLCANGTPQQVQAAINAGANVNARYANGFTPLAFAAGSNSNPEVIIALINAGANVNSRDREGRTPIMAAAIVNSNPAFIIILAKAGADVNVINDDIGMTLLMWATTMDNINPEVITALIESGANANVRHKSGIRAIDFAKRNKNIVNTDAYWKLHDASY